ncbi:DNA mismatch repair protein MutS [Commensalibacter sp. Nvir]|uniref:DNA mismatch repair protein MutS n=1 Tax=Commensalibacter sp. Nvir TaxID=3069817 RepID=UPI002D3D1AB6|nr:DNA mismatch repair protein MutS [Commensalibacter sp. Nvir]
MSIPSSEGATPVMLQWFALKKQQPHALLFFRMGDFFELFFDDAHAAANALDIALTSRGNHANKPIPMCGVPVGNASSYLARLIKKGFKVAVADQTEDPNKRNKNQKGPLSRAIVRLITPGTITEDELLNATQPNYILCIIPDQKKTHRYAGAAWIDISTGFFETTFLEIYQLKDFIARINPSEILISDTLLLDDYQEIITSLTELHDLHYAQRELTTLFNVHSLSALGDFNAEEIIASYELVLYIQSTQAGKIPQLSKPQSQKYQSILAIDPATRCSLEIVQNREGQQHFTLFSSVNYTLTAPGSRMLAGWLSSPSTEIELIVKRQEGWLYLQKDTTLLEKIRMELKKAPDISRALSRLSLGRGSPRDLVAIKNGLSSSHLIQSILQQYEPNLQAGFNIIKNIITILGHGQTLFAKLKNALLENPPLKLDEGAIIKENYDRELDNYRNLRDHSRQIIISFQQNYREKYNTNTLKIKHHTQLGYIIEVSSAQGSKLRDNKDLILRQGTANLTRFTTVELSELSEKILDAHAQAIEREKILFFSLVEEVLTEKDLPLIANSLAIIDVFQSCATLFQSFNWCVPKLSTDAQFNIYDGRHPVIENALKKQKNFTPNSCILSGEKKIMLLTGPNMAGKSTYLRQVALSVILAQSGLPVPAAKAEIGIVDRLFSRVGASDDLAHNRSTFMVEMTEAASILHQAGPKSLVVIDEIGRGTSTSDGLAIAWSILETLHNTLQCRAIFATHFHELVQLTHYLKNISPFTMKVQEWQGSIVFQYEVVPGAAEHSWGIHVAQLAGLPDQTIKRAQYLLSQLDGQKTNTQYNFSLTQNQTQPNAEHVKQLKILDEIRHIFSQNHPDNLTPKNSLNILYDLKKLIDK